MHLSEKITSLEQFRAISGPRNAVTWIQASRGAANIYNNGNDWFLPIAVTTGLSGYAATIKKTDAQYPARLWWYAREKYRKIHGIYAADTSVLRSLNAIGQIDFLCLHISREDPTMIAFTATPEDGMRDKQTRMALGRFIRRYLPLMTDEHVCALEADHRAEMNPSVQFHSFIDEFDKAQAAYTAIGACMSHSAEKYPAKKTPLLAYAAPGFSLAVMYRDDTPSARNIVWVNPEDPEDKRMVRTYGDIALETFLKRKGFVYKSFAGAYLKAETFKYPDGDGSMVDHLLCPYVDNASGESSSSNRYGIWDGAERIYIADDSPVGMQAVGIKNSSGMTQAKANTISHTCALTGKPINPFSSRAFPVWFNGAAGMTHDAAVKSWTVAYVSPTTRVYMQPGTQTFSQSSHSVIIEAPQVREAFGYKLLSDRLYPDLTALDLWALNTVSTPQGNVRDEDWVNYYEDQVNSKRHSSHLPEGAIRCASISDRRTYAAPGTNTVVTTTGRRVIPGVHEVAQTYAGEWMYRRHTKAVVMFSADIRYPSSMDFRTIRLTELPANIVDYVIGVVQARRETSTADELVVRIARALMKRELDGVGVSSFDASALRTFAATPLTPSSNTSYDMLVALYKHNLGLLLAATEHALAATADAA